MTVKSSWIALLSSVAAASPAALPGLRAPQGVAQSRPSGLDRRRHHVKGARCSVVPREASRTGQRRVAHRVQALRSPERAPTPARRARPACRRAGRSRRRRSPRRGRRRAAPRSACAHAPASITRQAPALGRGRGEGEPRLAEQPRLLVLVDVAVEDDAPVEPELGGARLERLAVVAVARDVERRVRDRGRDVEQQLDALVALEPPEVDERGRRARARAGEAMAGGSRPR